MHYATALVALATVAFLGGCMGAALPYNPEKMQADQIKALVSDKSATITCATTDTPYKGNVIHFNLDKAVIPKGGIKVNRDCSIEMTNDGTVPVAPRP